MIDLDNCVLWLDSKYFSESYWWDRSRYRNDGVVHGAKWKGNSFYFDGIDDYVFIPYIKIPINAFTYELWFKPSSILNNESERQDLVYGSSAARPHISFNKSGNGEIGIYVKINGTEYDDVLTTTNCWLRKWYHTVFSWDGNNFNVYVNGILEKTITHTGTHSLSTGMFIGSRADLFRFFNGFISMIRVYKKGLSSEEIKILYNTGYRKW